MRMNLTFATQQSFYLSLKFLILPLISTPLERRVGEVFSYETDADDHCGADTHDFRGRASSAAGALRRHDSLQTVMRTRLAELRRLESRQPTSVPPTLHVLPAMQRRILQLARQRLLVVCAL